MKELQQHRNAFELYFQLKQQGQYTQEALVAVGLQCGCSERTIYNWKKNSSGMKGKLYEPLEYKKMWKRK